MKTERHIRKRGAPLSVPGFLLRAIDERWVRLSAEIARNRRHCTEKGIHDLRVATRRLVASLELAAAVAPGQGFGRLLRVLRKQLKSFSSLRDLHVQTLRLRSLERQFPATRPLLSAMKTQETRLVREAHSLITRMDLPWVERHLADIALEVSAAGSGREGPHALRAALLGVAARKYLRVMARKRLLSASDPRSIHRVRVAFKEFRYTVEALTPLLPQIGKRDLKAMNAFQDVMGEIQDMEVLISMVRRFASSQRRLNAASFLTLHQHLALRRRGLVDAFMREAPLVGHFWPL